MAHQEGPLGVQIEEVGDGGQHVQTGGDLLDLLGLQLRGPDEEVGVEQEVVLLNPPQLLLQGVVLEVEVHVVGVEDHHGVLQVAAVLQAVHELFHEQIRLDGSGDGEAGVAPVDFVDLLGLFPVGLIDGVVAVGAVDGVGDDEGEEGVVGRHLLKAVDEVPVHLVVLHLHALAAVVLLVAQVGVDLPPLVDVPLAAVEGLRVVPGVPEEVGQGVGEGVLLVDGDGDARPAGGDQGGVDDELRVEGPGGDEGGGEVVHEGDALVPEPCQGGGVVLVDEPGVHGLQLDQDDVLALQQAGVFVVLLGRFVFTDVGLHPLPVHGGHGAVGADEGPDVPGGVLVQAAEHDAVGGVGKAVVDLGVLVLGLLLLLPDHGVLRGEVGALGVGDEADPDDHGGQAYQNGPGVGLRGHDGEHPAGAHHQDDGQDGPEEDKTVDADILPAGELPVPHEAQGGQGEEFPEEVVEPRVGLHIRHAEHQHHAAEGEFQPVGGQGEHQPHHDADPADGEQEGGVVVPARHPDLVVVDAEGVVVDQPGHDQGDHVEVGQGALHVPAVELRGEQAPAEGQAPLLPRGLFWFFCLHAC